MKEIELIALIPSTYSAVTYTCYMYCRKDMVLLPLRVTRDECESLLKAKSGNIDSTINLKDAPTENSVFSGFSYPSIYDTFFMSLVNLECVLDSVLIYKEYYGVFFSHLRIRSSKPDSSLVDVNISLIDGICLSLRSKCPILIFDEVLTKEGIKVTKDLLKRSLF